MKVDSNFFLGLAVGVAVGAAVVYLSKEGKKEELIEDFNSVVEKLKAKLCPTNCEQKEVHDEIIIAEQNL